MNGNMKGNDMSAKTYSEKLKDPRWQKKRLEILNRDKFKCQSCGNGELTLHVHHTKYIRGNDPWDYKDNFLVTLCELCHDNEHADSGEHYLIDSLKELGAISGDFLSIAIDIDLAISDFNAAQHRLSSDDFSGIGMAIKYLLIAQSRGLDINEISSQIFNSYLKESVN